MASSTCKPDPGLVFSGAVMTQPPAPPSRSSKLRPGSKGPNPTPPHQLMELKNRILTALGKLADRDTQQIAIEELDKIVEALSPDSISVCLSCLYDSDMQQKSVVKKECVRLFGSLALLHGDLLVHHLPKIISSITRRLRDPDSSVRDACIDAMGILSARMLCLSSARGQENGAQVAGSVTLVTFSKPLFDALSEQNKSVQTGAAMCLARVIESAKSPPLGAMARLCPRICKFMSNPNFLARPALLAVMGSLSQVGALGEHQLALLMPCMHEALGNSDWATRKAAAETLTQFVSNLGPALTSFKLATLQVLESCRFDKVKPVRDGVNEATQLWRTLPGSDSEFPGSLKEADGGELVSAIQSPELIPVDKEMTAVSEDIGKASGEDSVNVTTAHCSNNISAAVKMRVPAVTDKKLNLDFFQKLAERNSNDLQIEVVVPKSCPPQVSSPPKVTSKEVDTLRLGLSGEQVHNSSLSPYGSSLSAHDAAGQPQSDGESLYVDGTLAPECHGSKGVFSIRKGLEKGYMLWDEEDHEFGASNHARNMSNGTSKECETSNERSSWHFMLKQLCQLEQQQSSIMQMVQEFMTSSQETMSALQARVRELEKMVEGMAYDPESSAGRGNDMFGGFESNSTILAVKAFTGNECKGSKIGRGIDNQYRESINYSKSIRTGAFRPLAPISDDWDECLLSKNAPVDRQKVVTECGVTRRVWDRVPGPIGLGEGPSARSVWQASKDEATLAAIRVAGKDVDVLEVEPLSAEFTKLIAEESESGSSNSIMFKNGAQGRSQFWSLWASAMEFVHAGDMESAYVEVLCGEDGLMLIRLMNRTGPVLDQLTSGTAGEILQIVGQFLQQQSYLNTCIAWIQQAVDIMTTGGSECVDLAPTAKKEFLLSLQEVASLVTPEGWLGTTVSQLVEQLSGLWAMDIGSDS